VLHGTDAGWNAESLPWTGRLLWEVWVAPEGDVYVTTRSPTVIRRELDGSWSSFTPPGAEGIELRGVYGFPNGDVWFAGGFYDADKDEFDGGVALRYRRQY
jgi:hypothetical protein